MSQSERVTFEITPGPAHAGRNYILVGSFTGTSPGYDVGTVNLPLNYDRYFRFVQSGAWAGHVALENTAGQLNGAGEATARIRFMPEVFSGLIGTTLYHAYVLTAPTDYASGAIELTVLP